MSLPHLNWRYVGSRAFTTATAAGILEELILLGGASQTTYADGTARTGSASAGTWTEAPRNGGVLEAVYVSTPTNTLNQRILIGGVAANTTPALTMISATQTDTFAANALMVNITKNAGAFATWSSSTPFTTGQTMGWMKFWVTSSGAGNVYLWEATEAIAVAVSNTAGSLVSGFIAGAVFDPESDDTSSDAETDGRLYGVAKSGTSGISSFHAGAASDFLNTSATAGQAYAACFSPGTSTVQTLQQASLYGTTNTQAMGTTRLKSKSGRFVRAAILMQQFASPYNFIGRLRDVYAYTDSTLAAKQTEGANTIGYVFSGSATTASDCVLLEHA